MRGIGHPVRSLNRPPFIHIVAEDSVGFMQRIEPAKALFTVQIKSGIVQADERKRRGGTWGTPVFRLA